MMKPLTKRQLAAQATREKLLETAKALVEKDGLANITIEAIAKAAGVATGTFYTYFAKKEDILYTLTHETYAQIRERSETHQGLFEERLQFFMTEFAGYIEAGGVKLCQEWIKNTVDPDRITHPYPKAKLSMDLESLSTLLTEGLRRGELRPETPVEELSRMLLELLYGEMLCWAMQAGAYSFRERTERFTQHWLPSLLRPYLVKKTL